ncbi:hypothetical protein PFLmoz3_05057 [Pseudomonas fluorescens]|uniref:Uncharacterized protein n=1 Tax=Pseudomonas fluorescens TaxID=294 RepID=A0A120G6A1_PSEFL|nr:hypothetical protein PFLmoz3_05057 [Pseudomonas fluorescens]
MQIQAADEARLLATLPVRHQLVAVLRDPVQLPLVHHPRLNATAQAETVGGGYVVGHPDRVVGPGLLEGAVPNATVRARHRVVVARHLHFFQLGLDRHGRDAAELLGGKLDVEQRRVRVADLCVDNFSEAGDLHGVGDFVVVLIDRDPGDAHQPAGSCLGQTYATGALVHAGGLAVDSLTQYLLIGSTISGQFNLVFNPVPVDVAPRVHGLKRRPGKPHTHSGKLGVVDRPNPWGAAAQLGADGGLVLYRGDALNIGLVHGPGAPLPLHVWEVHVALRVLQRSIVEVDVLSGRCALKLALAHGNQHFGDGNRAQTVRGLCRRFWLFFAALGAVDVDVACCAHAFLQAKKNPLIGGYSNGD